MKKTAFLICLALVASWSAAALDTAALDERMAQVARWNYDEDRTPTRAVADMVAQAQGSAAELRQFETRFIALLQSNATLAAKDFVCKQLSVMGTEASVPALAPMLLDPKTAEMARYALERIPGPAAGHALREALPKANARTRIGIVNSLGRRRDAAAAAALRPLALGSDPNTAIPALFALAKIADPAALQVLADAQTSTAGDLRLRAAEAWLAAAERVAAAGKTADALAISRKLYAAGQPAMIRAGAFHLIAAFGGAQSVPTALEALRGNDSRLQAMAIRVLAQDAASRLSAEMPHLGEAAQIRVLGALAEKGDSSAVPLFTTAVNGSSAPVRLAAIEGMAKVGNASVVPLLAGIAAGSDTAAQNAARTSLAGMPGMDVDEAVAASIPRADTARKLVLIRAAGQRGSSAAGPVLLAEARDSDADVRLEALRALHDAGSAGEISGLLGLVAHPVLPGERAEAVHSLAAVIRRSDSARFHDVLAAYTAARDLETRASLMQVMGQSGSAAGMPILRAALNESNAEVKRAAIVALSEWPDDTPVPDLLDAARSESIPADQVLALRGAVRLTGLPGSRRTSSEKVEILAAVMGLAKQAEEKRAVLALLPRFPTREALDLANRAAADPEVAAEAKAAAARLERTVRP